MLPIWEFWKRRINFLCSYIRQSLCQYDKKNIIFFFVWKLHYFRQLFSYHRTNYNKHHFIHIYTYDKLSNISENSHMGCYRCFKRKRKKKRNIQLWYLINYADEIAQLSSVLRTSSSGIHYLNIQWGVPFIVFFFLHEIKKKNSRAITILKSDKKVEILN